MWYLDDIFVCQILQFSFIHFHTLRRVVVAEVQGGLEIPHVFQQSLIILVGSATRRTQSDRRWNHATRTLVGLMVFVAFQISSSAIS